MPGDPAATDSAPTATLQATNTPHAIIFSSEPLIPSSGESEGTSLPVDPNLLTGAEALAAAAAATAYALQRKEEKEAERKRQEAQSRAEAMAIVRAAEATKTANYLAKLANDERVKNAWAARLTGEAQAYNDARRYGAEAARYQGLADEYYAEQAAKTNKKLTAVEIATAGENVYTPPGYSDLTALFHMKESLTQAELDVLARRNYEILRSLLPSSVALQSFENCDYDYLLSYTPPEGYVLKPSVVDKIKQTEAYQWLENKANQVIDKYNGIWDNAQSAWQITTNGNATFGERLQASTYVTVAVGSHIMLALGLGILGFKSGVLPVLDAVENMTMIATAPEQLYNGEMTVGQLGIQLAFEFVDFGLPGNSYADEVLDAVDDINVAKGLDNIEDAVDVLDGGNPAKVLDEGEEILDVLDGDDVKLPNENVLTELSRPSSKDLRNNMIEAGIEVPEYSNAAHHIVAGGAKKAEEARAILLKYGVDINDADNGVFLPNVKDVDVGTYHNSLHSDAYYRKVTDLLSEAKSKEDVVDILNDISEQLSNGTFMN